MKSNGIQRSFKSGESTRNEGTPPGLGKVARMPGYGGVGVRRIDGYEDAQYRLRHLHIVGWSIACGVLSLVVLGGAFTFWLLPKLHRAKDTTDTDLMAADAHARVASKFTAPSGEAAVAMVRKALAVRNPEEVAGLIRPGPATALEVVRFLAAMKTVDGEIAEYIWLSSIDKNGIALEGVLVSFVETDQPRSRLAFLTPDEKGVWKMDFAAFARWVQPSWEDLLASKAESGIVRVLVARDRYFNGPFPDDKKFAAYSLASPDMVEVLPLVGYCRVDSAQYRAMEFMWAYAEEASVRATLEIRRVEGGDRRQFEISRVLAEDWVMSDIPLDEARK
ncbi:MAG: hypothetical protein NTW21_16385 [Verrucomicrobia bacterium]|nr:hypothetical protein [Verrucomicrobiota bacterium]